MAREGPPMTPLFAAARSSLLVSSDSQEKVDKSDTKNQDGEQGLSSLQLDLAQSTMDAILAAQRTISHGSPDQQVECVEVSAENVTISNLPRKRKSSASIVSSDSEYDRPSPPKKKKKKKEHEKKKKKKKKHKDDDRVRKEKSPPSPIKREEPELPFIPKGKIFLDDIPNIKPEHAYLLDRKANKDLYHYESVSKLHIPKYKPQCFNCLGKPDLYMKSEKKLNKNDKKNANRYFGKEGRKAIRLKGQHVTSEIDDGPLRSFIRLPQASAEKESQNKKDLGSYSCLDEATTLYSQGKGTGYSKPLDTDTDSFLMNEILQKVAFFNQKTREEPHNVQQWLDFVDFQDIAAQENKSFKGETIRLREVYQPTKAVIEKKLAILEKALAENPSSLKLKLAQLELYQDVWESEKLDKAWEDLLFVHSANVDIWRQYLCRQKSRLSKFTFNKVVKLYHKCFKTLIPIADGQVKVLNKPHDLEEKMIDLFCQYCDFLHHCGYTERAVSSYQALIEFNLYCPPSLNLSNTVERAAKFEDFWESGVAKYGESKAQGWAKWFEKKDSIQPSPSLEVNTDELEDAVIMEKLTRSQTWLALEKIRQQAHWLPWRPDAAKGETEESVEDLDRLVLFDDIAPALFTLHRSESCVKIVCLFIKFLGLTSERVHEISRQSYQKEFLQYSVNAVLQIPEIASFRIGFELDSRWKPAAQHLSLLFNVLQQAESYFVSVNRTLFTQLRLELEVKKNGVLKASELSKQDVKAILKFGKNLLKEHQNRNNLIVWDTFIRLQWACSDKMAETVSMIEVALGMFMGALSSGDPSMTLGLCCLCRTYGQILLNFEPTEHVKVAGKHSAPTAEDKRLVMACLGNLVENKSFKTVKTQEMSPAFVLRIQKRYQSRLKELVSGQDTQSSSSSSALITAFADCYALFEYCSSNFKAASSVYKTVRDDVRNQESANKDTSIFLNLYLSNISFATNVMHIDSLPLTEIRKIVESALEDFPESPQLHDTLIAIESGSYIAGRLRKYFEKRLKKPESVLSPLFAVISELLRHQVVISAADTSSPNVSGVYDSGTVHRVRSAFEQALQRPTCRHCPLLWRLYLHFETKMGSLSRSKGVLYRGLQNCPWVKELYLDAVAIFGDSELQEMTDLMTEKEIRVRMPPEEADLLMNAEKEEDKDDEKEEEMMEEAVPDEEELMIKPEIKTEVM